MITGLWQDFLTIAREEVGSRVVETWFKAISFDRWDDEQKIVYLRAPNMFVQEWVEKHYLSLLQIHMGRLLHAQMPRIQFLNTVESNKNEPQENKSSRAALTITPATTTRKNVMVTGYGKTTCQVNRNYVFETFVVGPSNSLAYAAAHAVTEQPGKLYNPLFIYGDSGLGKTHLLHAIGNGIKAKNKDVVILYQTADRFVSEFINAIRFNKVHKFQSKYHNVDVLLIDDIQFISNKEQTQEAFFHIFNALYEANKQIIFSSDTYPQDISGIAERLSSRLASGLVVDIHQPSLETKIAILKKKATLNSETLDDEVAHFIATQVISNVRELEGALIRVVAFAALTHQKITTELAQKVLARTVAQQPKSIEFDKIIQCVTKHYPYNMTDLRSKSRNKELATVRHIVMYLMKKLTDKSLRDIGAYLGGRDHSTVMHAISKVEAALEESSDVQAKVKHLHQEILR